MPIQRIPSSETSAAYLATEWLIASIYGMLAMQDAQFGRRSDAIAHVADVHMLAKFDTARAWAMR
jgi:hypothetical protein